MTKLEKLKWGCTPIIILVATLTAHGQVFTTLTSFDGTDGTQPYLMSLSQSSDGEFYGTTELGGNNFCSYAPGCGTAFKVDSSGTLSELYGFCGESNCSDGTLPFGGLLFASDGNFYGTTNLGGDLPCFPNYGCGTVFRLTASGVLTTLHTFVGYPNDGTQPATGLIEGTDGFLYGTTFGGGANDEGSVFRINKNGSLTTIYNFANTNDGHSPEGGLVEATDGNLYGTASNGGNYNHGTIFKISRQGKFTTVHAFNGLDGDYPYAPLFQAKDGYLYGTTISGGVNDAGTVFRMTLSGNLKTIYSFCSQPNCSDGGWPQASLLQATDGNLYGTTTEKGNVTCDCGTAFRISPQGTLTTIYTFCSQPNCTDGETPYGLLQATNGTLYGITGGGGAFLSGTVYSLDVGLGPFVAFVLPAGKVGQTGGILGQGFTGTTSVMLNGIPATFTVVSDAYLTATVPPGATTGYVTVNTPSGELTSNVPFRVIQ